MLPELKGLGHFCSWYNYNQVVILSYFNFINTFKEDPLGSQYHI